MLKGKYIGLRAVEREDLPQLMEWRNTSKYRQYFREFRELNLEQQNQWFENTVCKDPKTLMFSIVELSTNRLLGACGLCYINWTHRNADFSIYIGADDLYIDNKFADDAAMVMANYGFNEINMHRLWAEIYDFDEPKKQMFNRLGFTLDGMFRQTYWHDGKWHNSLFFSMLADEFANKYGTTAKELALQTKG